MKKINQKIDGNNNIQVAGDYIKTEKIKRLTEVIHDANEHISDAQALEIRNKITEIVNMVASEKTPKTKLFPQEYSAFYKAFGITKYTLVPKDKFDEAIKWLQKRIAYYGKPKLRQNNNEEWRKLQYKSINAKAGNLGWTKDQLLEFSQIALDLKTSITSLKELSDTRLKKLYTKIFSKK